MNWEEAGRGWGARALEWAYLFEPYARPANELLFDRLGIGDGERLLDIACGSGFAAHLAAERQATVTGLDAAEALVTIAQTRTPSGNFRVGDMFELPFADDSFDVATSFNGIWKGCEGALKEARRVLVPNGRLGLTFWGRYDRLGLMPYFIKVIELSPPEHGATNMDHGDTGREGVMEDMLEASGFSLVERGAVDVVSEWPDTDTAVRALAAAGPSVPAIEAVGYETFCEALHEVVSPLCDREVGVRVTSEFGWIVARAD
ncbi:MAG: class I SAM-dependent methyltransferase [Acidimicrobiales bacterium]|jgi:SAM-dependent methyltransferase